MRTLSRVSIILQPLVAGGVLELGIQDGMEGFVFLVVADSSKTPLWGG